MKKSEIIEIIKDEDYHIVKISQHFISTHTRKEIIELSSIAYSPLFLNVPLENQKKVVKKYIGSKDVIGKIAIFMECNNTLSGGRYSIVNQAVILCKLFKVDLIVDKKIDYLIDNFKKCYNYDNLTVIIDSNFLSSRYTNDYDFVIGIPNISAQHALVYCEKFNIPLISVMFESPNFVSKYKDGIDSSEEFWKNFRKVLLLSNIIITPSQLSMNYLKEWLGAEVDNDICYVVNPCMNTYSADLVKKMDVIDEYINDFVISTRLVNFKNPMNIFQELEKMKYKCNIHHIGSINIDDDNFDKLEYVNFIKHGNLNDIEKFKIINSCKALLHPSKFEGFGMPPMEALYFGKKVIAYDLPILRENYGDTIIYAKNSLDFASKIRDIDNIIVNNNVPNFCYPENTLGQLVSCISGIKTLTVTAGILAFNCIDYLDTVIKSIYYYVDKIIIVEGCVVHTKKYASSKFHSSDGTYEFLIEGDLYDPDGKIEIIVRDGDRPWTDKIEMQNEIAKRVETDLYIKVDADEVWEGETLRKIINFMLINNHIDIVRMKFLHFWTNFSTVAADAGGKWSTMHPRIWRFKKGFHHKDSFNYFVDENDNKVKNPNYGEYEWDKDEPIYHFGYAREKKYIFQKLNYYKNRGIEKIVDINIYESWKTMDDSTQPTQNVRSWAKEFNKDSLPKIMVNHIYYNQNDIRKI